MSPTRALVVNCSAPYYNLGAAKLADWLEGQGYQVTRDTGGPGLFAAEYDLVALSVIFSWHAPKARRIALECRDHCEVWCGGPGMAALGTWWRRETGLECVIGLDSRFDRQRGTYRMTFASRGCPVGCWFCIVPKIEGREFTLDPDFQPAPILCDNNLSALPAEFQEHIIRRYQETGIPLRDANSGFEPATFDGGTYARWKPVLRGPWRLAFDELGEESAVRETLRILETESPKRKQVYTLIGNEPVSVCYERVRKVIEWGGEPYAQPVMKLNALEKRPWVRFDWTERTLGDFARWVNRHLWRSVPLETYSNRQGEPPPFSDLLGRKSLKVVG